MKSKPKQGAKMARVIGKDQLELWSNVKRRNGWSKMEFEHREESFANMIFMWFVGVQGYSGAAVPSTVRKDASTTHGEIAFSAGNLGDHTDIVRLTR